MLATWRHETKESASVMMEYNTNRTTYVAGQERDDGREESVDRSKQRVVLRGNGDRSRESSQRLGRQDTSFGTKTDCLREHASFSFQLRSDRHACCKDCYSREPPRY